MASSNRPKPKWNVERIVSDMTLRGMNAHQLSQAAGLNPMTISLFLNGSRQTTKTAAKIADALGYSIRRYFSHIESAA